MYLLKSASAVLLVAAFGTPAHATENETERPPAFEEVVYQLVEAREHVELQVARVKQRFKLPDEQYRNTEKLYGNALASCRAWTAAVKVAILAGNRKNLTKDAIHKKWASECGSRGQALIDYAETVFVQSKGVPWAIFSSLIDGETKLWNATRDRQEKERADLAKMFSEEVAWKDWRKIAPTDSNASDKP